MNDAHLPSESDSPAPDEMYGAEFFRNLDKDLGSEPDDNVVSIEAARSLREPEVDRESTVAQLQAEVDHARAAFMAAAEKHGIDVIQQGTSVRATSEHWANPKRGLIEALDEVGPAEERLEAAEAALAAAVPDAPTTEKMQVNAVGDVADRGQRLMPDAGPDTMYDETGWVPLSQAAQTLRDVHAQLSRDQPK